MNVSIIYFSKFGNTQLIAEAIAEEFESNGKVKLIHSEDLTPEALNGAHLVVMGTPTHKMNLPEAVRPVFDRLPRRSLRKVPVAAFDTSYKMSALLSKFTASKRLNRKLRKLGGKSLLPPETFHVEGREGPLYEGELDRARRWARRIYERING